MIEYIKKIYDKIKINSSTNYDSYYYLGSLGSDREVINKLAALIGALLDNIYNKNKEIEELKKENRILKAKLESMSSDNKAKMSQVIGGAKINSKCISKENIQMLLDDGYSKKEIAEILKISRSTIWRILNSDNK